MLPASLACRRYPDSYSPPPQFEMPPRPEGPNAAAFFAMDDPGAPGHLLAGVLNPNSDGPARWTGPHPRFSFTLDRADNLDFSMHFSVHDHTFRDTGPVTVTIRVNGQVIDRSRFNTPGEREYRCAAPRQVLEAARPVIVDMDIDPPWIGEDGVRLGILIFSIGFRERGG